MSGLLTPAAGLDRSCPSAPVGASGAAADRSSEAAAIVSWYGATDVNDLLIGPNARGFAIAWLGSQPNREEIARRVSPMTYARPGAPAVFTVHGDADGVVPLSHATRLHAELTKHGVPNRLHTVPGGGHGGFTRDQSEKSFAALREFLGERGLLPARK